MHGGLAMVRGRHNGASLSGSKKAYLDKYGVRLGFVEWKKLEVQRMSHSDKTLASLYSDD